MTITISIDAMGGDYGLEVTIPASLQALEKHATLHLILVGDQERISSHLASIDPVLKQRIRIQHASQQVEMDESPSSALRKTPLCVLRSIWLRQTRPEPVSVLVIPAH